MRVATAGIVLLVVGIAIFALTLVRLSGGAALDPQTKVAGTVTAEIAAPGRYYLWDNHWTVFDGERIKYSADCPEGAEVTVTDAGGSALEFVADASQSWSIGNNGKTSIGYVDVPSATTIRLVIDDVGGERIVSVSNRTLREELWPRLGGFGIGLVVAAVGAMLSFLGVFWRRRLSNGASAVKTA